MPFVINLLKFEKTYPICFLKKNIIEILMNEYIIIENHWGKSHKFSCSWPPNQAINSSSSSNDQSIQLSVYWHITVSFSLICKV